MWIKFSPFVFLEKIEINEKDLPLMEVPSHYLFK